MIAEMIENGFPRCKKIEYIAPLLGEKDMVMRLVGSPEFTHCIMFWVTDEEGKKWRGSIPLKLGQGSAVLCGE